MLFDGQIPNVSVHLYFIRLSFYHQVFHFHFSVFQDLNAEESVELDIRVRQSLERRYKAAYEAEKAAFLQHLK